MWLTEDQYRVLDLVASNPAISVIGGPGTGKTWLALEQAARWARQKKRVLLVCYSQGLSRWLQQAVDARGDRVSRSTSRRSRRTSWGRVSRFPRSSIRTGGTSRCRCWRRR